MDNLKVTVAMDVLKLGMDRVTNDLYRAAEKVVEEFLNPKTCDGRN